MSEANGKVRYGTSALDLSYKAHAVKDELLIEGNTGKTLYKRPDDGHIVAFDDVDYTAETMSNDMASAIYDTSHIVTASDDYIVYYKMDIRKQTDILMNTTDIQLTNVHTFRVSGKEKGLFIRVRTSVNTNSVVRYLEELYSIKNSDSVTKHVILTLEVSEYNETENAVNIIYENVNLNTLAFIPLTTQLTDTSYFMVKIKSIKFPYLAGVYDSLTNETKELIKEINYGNSKLECTDIDVITYIDDMSVDGVLSNPNDTKMVLMVPMKESSTSLKNGGIIVSKTKPTYECVWGKILNI